MCRITHVSLDTFVWIRSVEDVGRRKSSQRSPRYNTIVPLFLVPLMVEPRTARLLSDFLVHYVSGSRRQRHRARESLGRDRVTGGLSAIHKGLTAQCLHLPLMPISSLSVCSALLRISLLSDLTSFCLGFCVQNCPRIQ